MKFINGLWWPDGDRRCHPVVPGTERDMDRAITLCKGKTCAVQAGGNVGIWANYLARTFARVWTFEPDFENYACLKRNVSAPNVTALHAGLGAEFGFAGLETPEADNAGAHRLSDGAEFPVLTIDMLALRACDLIVLDTEGNEASILDGAKDTIRAFRPVLMIEDKGLSEHFGVAKGWTDAIEGYRVAGRVHRDVILVPE